MIAYVFNFDIPIYKIHGNYTDSQNKVYSKIADVEKASKNLDEYIKEIHKLTNLLAINEDAKNRPGGYLVDFGDLKLHQKNVIMTISSYSNRMYIEQCIVSPLGLGHSPYKYITTKTQFTEFLPEKYFDVGLLESQNLVVYYDVFTAFMSACFGCFLNINPMDFEYTLSKYNCNIGFIEFKECFNSLTDYTKFVLENKEKC